MYSEPKLAQDGASQVALVVKNPPVMQEMGLIPGLGRFPGVGSGNSLQYSCLENSINRGTWRATVCYSLAKSQTEHVCTLAQDRGVGRKKGTPVSA